MTADNWLSLQSESKKLPCISTISRSKNWGSSPCIARTQSQFEAAHPLKLPDQEVWTNDEGMPHHITSELSNNSFLICPCLERKNKTMKRVAHIRKETELSKLERIRIETYNFQIHSRTGHTFSTAVSPKISGFLIDTFHWHGHWKARLKSMLEGLGPLPAAQIHAKQWWLETCFWGQTLDSWHLNWIKNDNKTNRET